MVNKYNLIENTYIATQGRTQIHTYEGNNSSLINIGFERINKFSFGHHVRSGGGMDVLNFIDIQKIQNTVVGRFEDFDFSRDRISIEGRPLDLLDLPQNVKIVSYDGEHNDAGTDPQQWLLIDTGRGRIFYTLEGARVDMNHNGGSNAGFHEAHFMKNVPNFERLPVVSYIDPMNTVPDGISPNGGVIINDTDRTKQDVEADIQGSNKGDLIAAGLNDDTVHARNGKDVVWGGSGHDRILGEGGADTLYGNTGDDRLFGGGASDRLLGGYGDDVLKGGSGRDALFGESGDDRLFGGSQEDTLFGGSGSDVLKGGGRGDRLAGGAGADRLIGQNGPDQLIGGTGPDTFIFRKASDSKSKEGQYDVILDFKSGVDRIDLSLIDANKDRDGDQSFKFIDTSDFKAHNRSGEVRFEVNDDATIVHVDINANGFADMWIRLENITSLSDQDFIL